MNRTAAPSHATFGLLACMALLAGCSQEHGRSPHAADDILQRPLRKIRWLGVWLVLAACVGVGSPPALAADLKPGTHAGTLQGALYRIDIPAGWNSDLVMRMHCDQPVGGPRPTPMKAADETSMFLEQGDAVAQRDYASQGWAVVEASVDNERVRY